MQKRLQLVLASAPHALHLQCNQHIRRIGCKAHHHTLHGPLTIWHSLVGLIQALLLSGKLHLSHNQNQFVGSTQRNMLEPAKTSILRQSTFSAGKLRSWLSPLLGVQDDVSQTTVVQQLNLELLA